MQNLQSSGVAEAAEKLSKNIENLNNSIKDFNKVTNKYSKRLEILTYILIYMGLIQVTIGTLEHSLVRSIIIFVLLIGLFVTSVIINKKSK